MPLHREWSPDAHSLAAVWKIEEPESFFVQGTGIFSEIRAERRRLEHLAGRYLLKHLKEDFPLLTIARDQHDKPRLPEDQYRFSISHSYPFVAAIVSDRHECGIDIQTWHPRILSIQHKFLSETEQLLFGNDPRKAILAWAFKEAAYKWQGRRGVDFIEHMPVISLKKTSEEWVATIELCLEEPATLLEVTGCLEDGFATAWVAALH